MELRVKSDKAKKAVDKGASGSGARTPAGALFTDLIFETFRFYSRINAAGDVLSEDTGLTSARWRVLGSVLPQPRSVAQIARERGLTRQSVQQIANSLVRDGLAKLQHNERHKSSKLLAPTERGRAAVLALNSRQIAWANQVGEIVKASDLKTALEIITKLRRCLEGKELSEKQPKMKLTGPEKLTGP